MTYLSRPRARVRQPKALGGMFDDWIDAAKQKLGQPTQEGECSANADIAAGEVNRRRDDLVANWKPTGFYTPTEMNKLIVSTLDVLRSASAAVTKAASSIPADSRSSLDNEWSAVQRQFGEAQKYNDAVREALAGGITAINAPGLRDWVLSAMRTAAGAIWAAAFVSCLTPWWMGVLSSFVALVDTLYRIARAIVGVVVKIGETVLKVAGDLPQIWTIAKWGALAAGGVFAAIKLGEMRRKGR